MAAEVNDLATIAAPKRRLYLMIRAQSTFNNGATVDPSKNPSFARTSSPGRRSPSFSWHTLVSWRGTHTSSTPSGKLSGTKDEDTPPSSHATGGPPARKTHRSKAECGEEVFYLRRPTSGKWWAGYRRPDPCHHRRGRQGVHHPHRPSALLDKGAPMIEDKGITMTFRATHIWLTANAHPAHWMPKSGRESRAGMLRRIMQYGRIEHIPCRTDIQATRLQTPANLAAAELG
ncbi:MAG: hypothetical protein WDW38_006413 [Sanguina aurantia]